MSTPIPLRRSWFAVWRWRFLSRDRFRIPVFVLLCFLAAIVAYQSAYTLMVDEVLAVTAGPQSIEMRPWPDYSCGNAIPIKWSLRLGRFFGAAHFLDKNLRPGKWSLLTHPLIPSEIDAGVAQVQFKPEWKRHLAPNSETLKVEIKLPKTPPASFSTSRADSP